MEGLKEAGSVNTSVYVTEVGEQGVCDSGNLRKVTLSLGRGMMPDHSLMMPG